MKCKLFILLIVILIFTFIATGCKYLNFGRVEINDLLILNVAGIDKLYNDDVITISAASKSVNAASEQTGNTAVGQKSKSKLLIAEGKTAFEAIWKLSTFADSMIFWGHVDYILVGENAAKDNLPQYLDFFMRDHELRLNSKIIIVKDNTALNVLRKTVDENNFIGDILDSLFQTKGRMSISDELFLVEIMNLFDSPHTSAYVPCVELIDDPYYKIKLSGFAVFKDTKLLGYITDEIARGFNWVRDRIDSTAISVKDRNGQNISLEVVDSKTEVKPIISGGKLESIKINIRFSTNITGVTGTKNIFEKDVLDFLKSQQEEVVRNEVKKVIEFAQKNNIDIFGICGILHRKKPVYWRSMEDQWHELFPKINFIIEIDSNINRTYDIKQPVRSGYGVEQ